MVIYKHFTVLAEDPGSPKKGGSQLPVMAATEDLTSLFWTPQTTTVMYTQYIHTHTHTYP